MVPAIGNLSLASRKIEAIQTRPQARLIFDLSLVALSAAFYTLASAPFDWSALGWFALTPLFLTLRRATLRRSFLYGLAFGELICAGVAHWMYAAIATYFVAMFPVDLILTVLCFAVFVGSYTAVTAVAWSILMRRPQTLARGIAIPALWVVCEFARSTFLSGFSWGLLGYSQSRHLLVIQIADVAGIWGISFLLAYSSFAAAEVIFYIADRLHDSGIAKAPWADLSAVAAAIAITLTYGAFELHRYDPGRAQPTIRVALVEHDMPAQDRWKRINHVKSLFSYIQLTKSGVAGGSADLIIWPEFASGLYLEQDPQVRLEIARLAREEKTFLLLGAPRTADNTQYYNSAYLVASDGGILDSYDKMRLLPFAEYRPFGLPSLVNHSSDLPQKFTPGKRSTIFAIPTARFGIVICYEATYPEYARSLTRRGAQFLVNMSNDVWLSGAGGRAAASQHFAMATLRAVENKRVLARATMAGITGFVDELGRPFALTAGREAVTSAAVSLRDEMTIYTRFGDWFVLLCALYSGLSLIVGIRGRSSNDRPR